MTKKKEETKTYAKFWQRFCAFLIDMCVISVCSILLSWIFQPFINQENYQRLSDEANSTIQDYTNQKIDSQTYLTRTSDISYDMDRATALITIAGIAISILYFGLWQYKHDGQTIGKKFMKIKIIKKDDSPLTINDILLRALLIDSILADIIGVCFAIFASKNVYFYGIVVSRTLQYFILFISAMMVLSTKTKQGLHDILLKTEVIQIEQGV